GVVSSDLRNCRGLTVRARGAADLRARPTGADVVGARPGPQHSVSPRAITARQLQALVRRRATPLRSHGTSMVLPSPAYRYWAAKTRCKTANAGSPVQCPGPIRSTCQWS